jgi:uncharacterized protein YunC (DUF1805 family)
MNILKNPIMTHQIKINDIIFDSYKIPTQNTNVLMISGKNGFLACGYINIEVANKRNDVCAIVTGVKNLNDMLEAEVIKVSNAAIAAGILIGMKGKDALLKMY